MQLALIHSIQFPSAARFSAAALEPKTPTIDLHCLVPLVDIGEKCDIILLPKWIPTKEVAVRSQGLNFSKLILALVILTPLSAWPPALLAQGRQQVKVTVDFRQTGNQSEEALHGGGSVVITGRGGVYPSGGLSARDKQTTVRRSTAIFTIVQDGGESILSVTTRIPHREVAFYRDYATGAGYIASSVAFHEVGTSLKVSATILQGNQVDVRLTPRISYFSPDRSGAIDLTEASTELVVPSGQPVALGGATTEMHDVTRRILGFGDRSATNETLLFLTATIQ